MANAMWARGKAKILAGTVLVLTDSIKVVVLDGTYTFNAAHEFASSIAAAEVSRSAALTTKTVDATTGAFKSDNALCATVTGADIEQIAIIKDTGSDATSPLIAFFDTGITGEPLEPDGSDVRIIMDAAGWFAL